MLNSWKLYCIRKQGPQNEHDLTTVLAEAVISHGRISYKHTRIFAVDFAKHGLPLLCKLFSTVKMSV